MDGDPHHLREDEQFTMGKSRRGGSYPFRAIVIR